MLVVIVRDAEYAGIAEFWRLLGVRAARRSRVGPHSHQLDNGLNSVKLDTVGGTGEEIPMDMRNEFGSIPSEYGRVFLPDISECYPSAIQHFVAMRDPQLRGSNCGAEDPVYELRYTTRTLQTRPNP